MPGDKHEADIKNTDMDDDMQKEAVKVGKEAFDKFTIEKDVAAYIKREFDKRYSPNWHCIVGKNFGSYVTHESTRFIYFYLGNTAVLLFKTA